MNNCGALLKVNRLLNLKQCTGVCGNGFKTEEKKVVIKFSGVEKNVDES